MMKWEYEWCFVVSLVKIPVDENQLKLCQEFVEYFFSSKLFNTQTENIAKFKQHFMHFMMENLVEKCLILNNFAVQSFSLSSF